MATTRATLWWWCLRKIRHATESDAAVVAHKTRPRPWCFINEYQCKYCGGWHVGNVRMFPRPPRR